MWSIASSAIWACEDGAACARSRGRASEAAAWYKKGSPDVARRFLSEVRSLAREVARIPLRFPVLVKPELDPPVRRALVPGFPYALIFLATTDVVHLLAVAHQHRAPGYWLHRVRR